MTSKTTTPADSPITAYKAFNSDWTCLGYQYEVGKTYKHEGDVKICSSGFHACLHPLDVLNYYPAAGSKFAVVSLPEVTADHDGDTKVCSAEITIKAELHINELVEAAVKYVFDAAKWIKGQSATGYRGAASATGYRGAASATGASGAASATGDCGAASATGTSGAASATGGGGAASATGDCGVASATGTSGAASATGYRGAALATGYRGAALATGDCGAASATGTSGAASATGTSGAASATGDCGAAMAIGYAGRAMGAEGCAIFLCERDIETNEILCAWAGIAGRDGIKANTFYTLKNGAPVEVEA